MMATFLKFIVAGLFVFYIGECLGLYMQCDSLDDLQCAKSYVWLVPFLQLALAFKTLIFEIKEKDFRCFVGSLRVGQSSTIILSILASCLRTDGLRLCKKNNIIEFSKKKPRKYVRKCGLCGERYEQSEMRRSDCSPNGWICRDCIDMKHPEYYDEFE